MPDYHHGNFCNPPDALLHVTPPSAQKKSLCHRFLPSRHTRISRHIHRRHTYPLPHLSLIAVVKSPPTGTSGVGSGDLSLVPPVGPAVRLAVHRRLHTNYNITICKGDKGRGLDLACIIMTMGMTKLSAGGWSRRAGEAKGLIGEALPISIAEH